MSMWISVKEKVLFDRGVSLSYVFFITAHGEMKIGEVGLSEIIESGI